MSLGRPTKYGPERAEAILAALRRGASLQEAAAAGGIAYDSLVRWRARYADFGEAVSGARAAGALHLLRLINGAAQQGDWRAAAWILEHRYPEDFGRTTRYVRGAKGEPFLVKVEVVHVDDTTRREEVNATERDSTE